MIADIEARCGECGGNDLYCGECDPDRATEDGVSERSWHAVIHPLVRDDITRRRCPCETAEFSGHWLLCSYHEGYQDGIAVALA